MDVVILPVMNVDGYYYCRKHSSVRNILLWDRELQVTIFITQCEGIQDRPGLLDFGFYAVASGFQVLTCEQALRGAFSRGGKRKESLQIRLSKLNSTSNAPVAPRQLSCPISANQREAETSANVKKKTGNDVIANVISANQHFASTFSMQIDIQIPET